MSAYSSLSCGLQFLGLAILAAVASSTYAHAQSHMTGCKFVHQTSSCSQPKFFTSIPSHGSICPSTVTPPKTPAGKTCIYRGTYTPVLIPGSPPYSSQQLSINSNAGHCLFPDSLPIDNCHPRDFQGRCGESSQVEITSSGPGELDLNWCCYENGDEGLCHGLPSVQCPLPNCANDTCPIFNIPDDQTEIEWYIKDIDDYSLTENKYTSEPGITAGGILWPRRNHPTNQIPQWSDETDDTVSCEYRVWAKQKGHVQADSPPVLEIIQMPGAHCGNFGDPSHSFSHDVSVEGGKCGDSTTRAKSAKVPLMGCQATVAHFVCTYDTNPEWSQAPADSCPGRSMYEMWVANRKWDNSSIRFRTNDKDGISFFASVCCRNTEPGKSNMKCHEIKKALLVKQE